VSAFNSALSLNLSESQQILHHSTKRIVSVSGEFSLFYGLANLCGSCLHRLRSERSQVRPLPRVPLSSFKHNPISLRDLFEDNSKRVVYAALLK
jgi:hypothetical protein